MAPGASSFALAADLLRMATGLAMLLIVRSRSTTLADAYAGLIGIVAMAGPLANGGMEHLGLKALVSAPTSAVEGRTWTSIVSTMTLSGLLVAPIAVAAGMGLTRAALPVVVAVVGAELALGSTVDGAVTILLGCGRHHLALKLRLASALVRISAAVGVALTSHSLVLYGVALAAGSGLTLAVFVPTVCRADALGKNLRPIRGGGMLALSGMLAAASNDFDKVMLSALGGPGVASSYTIAYRLVTAATLPGRAVVTATYGRVFAEDAVGDPSGSVRTFAVGLAKRLAVLTLAATVAVFVTLLVLVPMRVQSSQVVVAMALWLCVVPTLRVLAYPSMNLLVGLGRSRARVRITVAVAIANVVVVPVLVVLFGWRGAALSTVLADLATALAGLFAVRSRRNNRGDQQMRSGQ